MKITCTIIELQKLLKKVEHAMSTDEERYYLNGVCIEKKDNEIFLVATNGHQLAAIDLTKNENIGIESREKNVSAIISRSTVKSLLAIKGGQKTFGTALITIDVKISKDINQSKITFEYGCEQTGYKISQTHHLIDATYPEWRKVLPQKNKPTICVNPDYLGKLCKALQVDGKAAQLVFNLAEENTSSAPISITDQKGGIFLIMPMRIM